MNKHRNECCIATDGEGDGGRRASGAPRRDAGRRAPAPRAAAPAPNFLRAIVAEDSRTGKYGGRVVTRFPPEPNGYLHYGHAKSIILNFGLAAENNGTCHLRYDDTNPLKEEVEYEDAIAESVRWLGYDWGEHRYHASDYYGDLYRFAEWFIENGLAYVDSQSAEAVRAHARHADAAGDRQPLSRSSIAENLDLFRRMRAGEFPDGAHVLRLKIDMGSPNINMRDPAIYRIRHASHHRTGDTWCIYPLYDYTHAISDALERITHSICTLEFQDHRPLYDWVIEKLADGGMLARPLPQQYEFARLNLTYVVLSKRRLIELVEQGHVDGWDDPRMPTLVGARRRGFTPEGFRLFAERIGVSKADSWIDMSVLEDCMRDDLNARAERRIAVLDPVKLVIDNYAEARARTASRPIIRNAGTGQAGVAADARIVDRARRLHRRSAQGLLPVDPRRRSAASLWLHRALHRRREGCGRQRYRRPLHLRSGYAQRNPRRGCPQGEGQHPLALCGARACRRKCASTIGSSACRFPARAIRGARAATPRAEEPAPRGTWSSRATRTTVSRSRSATISTISIRTRSGSSRVRRTRAGARRAGRTRPVRAARLFRRGPRRSCSGKTGIQPRGDAAGLLVQVVRGVRLAAVPRRAEARPTRAAESCVHAASPSCRHSVRMRAEPRYHGAANHLLRAVMKRIVLFLATNLAVIVVLSIVLKLFGLDNRYAGAGVDYTGLLMFSAVVGFGGAIISLLMSKTIAKWSTGAHVIEQPRKRSRSVAGRDRAAARRRKRASACPKWRSTKARPMRSPPALSRIRRWSRCRPACCSR